MTKKNEGKDEISLAAAALGSRGGTARAANITDTRKSAIARQGALARNKKHGNPRGNKKP